MSNLPSVPCDNFILKAWRSFRYCLRKDNYARFAGRAGRMEYWSTTIIGSLFSIVPFLLFPILGYLFIIIELIVIFYLAMPMLSVFVRRLHDVNWSAWWISLYYFLVSVAFAWIVFWFVQEILSSDIYLQSVDIESFRLDNFYIHLLQLLVDSISVLLFVLTLLPGTKGVNKYGEPV